MKVAGIIAEYNPFHKGHEYQIKKARDLGADYVVIAMSGDFTQRGEPAIMDKYKRAEMALKGGADLILELPVTFVLSDARTFARGGISLLNNLGVITELVFGAEKGTEESIFRLSEFYDRPPTIYEDTLNNNLKKGMNFPMARANALKLIFSESEIEAINNPNSILGLEYCVALRHLNSKMRACPIERVGSAYLDTELGEECLASAAAIREALSCGGKEEALGKYLPEATWKIILENREADPVENGLVNTGDFDDLLHYKLITEEDFTKYSDITGVFSNRIKSMAGQYRSIEDFAGILKSKNITRTSVNRLLFHIILDMKQKAPPQVSYGRILGLKSGNERLMKAIKENTRIPLISKLKDAELNDTLRMDIQAANIYNSIAIKKTKAGESYKSEFSREIVVL